MREPAPYEEVIRTVGTGAHYAGQESAICHDDELMVIMKRSMELKGFPWRYGLGNILSHNISTQKVQWYFRRSSTVKKEFFTPKIIGSNNVVQTYLEQNLDSEPGKNANVHQTLADEGAPQCCTYPVLLHCSWVGVTVSKGINWHKEIVQPCVWEAACHGCINNQIEMFSDAQCHKWF